LAGRGKKNVGLSEVKVQVCLYAFDLMYLNGEVDLCFTQLMVESPG
jgi:ATP-dependent DNA ligase